MGMGIGKHYLVQLIKYHSGTLDECIEFMQKNKPANNLYWYELTPMPETKNWKRGKTRLTCTKYKCLLVTDGELFKSS